LGNNSREPITGRLESGDRGGEHVPHRALLYPFPDVPPVKFNREAKGQQDGPTDACAILFFFVAFIPMTNVS